MSANGRITFDDGKPSIRGISVIDIYRNLIFGRAEKEILRQHPDFVREDFLAVRE